MILEVTPDEFSEIRSRSNSMHSMDFSLWMRERYPQLAELQFLEAVDVRVVGPGYVPKTPRVDPPPFPYSEDDSEVEYGR